MEDFKARLIRLMKEKKYNNSTLAIAIGAKSPSTVQQWVVGKGMPELNNIEKISIQLNTTPAYLLYGIKEPAPPEQLREPEETYGIKIEKSELIEFYKWKADQAAKASEIATKQIERLQNSQVDAK